MTPEIPIPEQSKSPEPAQERPIFPVTAESVGDALKFIARDPDAAILIEGENVRVSNPMLHVGIMSLHDRLRRGGEKFVDGSLWSHAILRTAAEKANTEVPKITERGFEAHLVSRVQEAIERGDPIADANRHLEAIRKGDPEHGIVPDPEFAGAIDEITGYMTERNFFLFGATMTYLPIRAAYEAEQMKKQFSLGDDNPPA
jgi:hypothetical protein